MNPATDEGFTDEDVVNRLGIRRDLWFGVTSMREREELAYNLLASLPRSSLATVQRRIVPLLQLDVVGLLPDEVALHVFSYLPSQTLLTCSLVSRRWRALADDQSLWKSLCIARDFEWRTPQPYNTGSTSDLNASDDSDDEGMGDEEDSECAVQHMLQEDSGFASMLVDSSFALSSSDATSPLMKQSAYKNKPKSNVRLSALSISSPSPMSHMKPDYKLLHQTHMRLHNRILSGSYSLSNLQTRGATNSHTNTIYCLQLYTYPETGVQVLFTGSKDRTVREWNLETGDVIRVIEGVHESSVLSICVHNGLLASGGSDRKVAVWDLAHNALLKEIQDHEDSVLCVRFDDERLVSCSKDRTVRTYLLPKLIPEHVLRDHRAAVNAVSVSPTHIISASGDRSMRLWDAKTGALLRTFENHHGRGIASIDYKPPFVLSGSSDKHLRLLDISTSQGWSTSREIDKSSGTSAVTTSGICQACGSNASVLTTGENARFGGRQRAHEDLVRSVALNSDFVISGSYDYTVKVSPGMTVVCICLVYLILFILSIPGLGPQNWSASSRSLWGTQWQNFLRRIRLRKDHIMWRGSGMTVVFSLLAACY
ncbi:hypothetical protein AcW2_005069 [Taiwanofungus camphoratus]|nr:hypothetical protein AcW2_005069 [Antrodia cinnamomea]